jgi:hypothetical protein
MHRGNKPKHSMNRTDLEMVVINKEPVYRVVASDDLNSLKYDKVLIVSVEDMAPHTNYSGGYKEDLFFYSYCFVDNGVAEILPGLYKVSSHNKHIFMFKAEEEAIEFIFTVGLYSVNKQIASINKAIRGMNAIGLKKCKKINPIENRKVG